MGRLIKAPATGSAIASPERQAGQPAATTSTAALDEAARQRGYAAGEAAGRDAARAEATEILARARLDAEGIRLESRDAAFALARRMAERIVGRTLELHPGVIAEISAQALEASRARSGPVILRVHPDDLPLVEAERPLLCARLRESLALHLCADEAVGRGGCIVETPAGRLDARLGSQLDALERALGDRAGKSRP